MDKEDKNDTWHRVERSSGKFLRRLRLPEIRECEDGSGQGSAVPKEEIKKPEVKAIVICWGTQELGFVRNYCKWWVVFA